ncbi:MAG: nucleotide sugar dehydrogenase [Thermoflavifilum sp.]|nr:nucleotide sugar dehydrogenase [Thermoflavifilum sp.]
MHQFPPQQIAIIGLGYVGLPLAAEFAKKYRVIGYDINPQRIQALNQGIDRTLEVEKELLLELITKGKQAHHTGLICTHRVEDIRAAQVYIITVPTPIDVHKKPDLRLLLAASATVGQVLKPQDIVIYESTVYPGCTEEDCVPVLEKHSGLRFNQDFYVGYSPERMNPGDKKHRVSQIKKVTSGSTPEVADYVDRLYASIISAGTHRAPSIRVAEAAKVIENAQRDINIAFVNELAKIFHCMNIDTHDVLAAASTKWNFLPFTPGLVGGHCIGVDPYYLAQKAQQVGYHPEIILAGRRLNDGMGYYIAQQVVKLMVHHEIKIKGAEVLVLGITFKENCPDVRNTRVVDVVKELQSFGIRVEVADPWADPAQVAEEYQLELKPREALKQYDAIILAVAHSCFRDWQVEQYKKPNGVIYDVKAFLDRSLVDGRL